MPVNRFELDAPWRLTHFPQETFTPQEVTTGKCHVDWIPAEVPGNVVLDLYRAGLVDDPFMGMNPEKLRPLEFHEWWYQTRFTLPADPAPGGAINLAFDGIDTFAEIYLDGVLIGQTENMLIGHRIPLPADARAGEAHTLHVRIKSDQYEVSQNDFDGVVELVGNDPSRVWIRKGGYTHGWDIFPRMLSAGIWKDVWLEYEPAYRIDDVFVLTTKWGREECAIMARVSLKCPRNYRAGLSVRFRLLDGTREVYRETYAVQFPLVVFRFQLKDPRFWWPRPYGEQHLYEVQADLLGDDGVIDQWSGHFGCRSIEIAQEPLTDGRRSFYFKINGEPIAVYGTNHVPLDSFPSQMARRMGQAMELLEDSRCNMVRVWGGGVYEPREFYEACDRMGVMVWQDFMFSCALYPQQDSFLDLVRQEVKQVVKALRNHPSIVLYCGDNEIETHMSHYFSPHQTGGNRAIAHEVLPEYLTRYDGTRPYWPSSPYTPIQGETAHSHKGGDTHIWCHGLDYRAPVYSRDDSSFISEIGHLALPNRAAIERFIPKELLWPFDRRVWGYRSGVLNDPLFYGFPDGRLKAIEKNVANFLGELPGNLDDMIFASQIVQAEAFKTWIERVRRRKFDCGGILWWNLLDGCPQCSDSVVDYYFGRKIAYEYIRRVQDDLLLCMEEIDGELQMFLVSDSLDERELSYRVVCDETVLCEGQVTVPANGVVALGSVAAPSPQARLFLLEAEGGEKVYHNHFLDGRAPFDLEQIREFFGKIENLAPSISSIIPESAAGRTAQ